jgi:hypothetical protein
MRKRGRWSIAAGLILAGAWAALASGGVRAADAPAPPDLLAVRRTAAARVCLVTVRDGPGAGLAYATGFLIGDGRFVLTDLAAAAQPGAAQADLAFEDGKTSKAVAFGMADAVLGVVALRVEGEPLAQGGLGLARPAFPADEPRQAVAVGWQWGERLDVAEGRLAAGPPAAELAAQVGLAAPPGDRTFLAWSGAPLGGAGGAPVLERDGTVAGVLLDLAAGARPPTVVPAAAIREALLGAKAELRPLAALPNPFWPTRLRLLAGEPVRPGSVGLATRDLKTRIRCAKCLGKGTIAVRRVIGQRTILGTSYPIWGYVPETCPACQGETVALKGDTYQYFSKIALLGTRAWYQPESGPDERAAVRESVGDLLKGLAKAGPQFRGALAAAAAEALQKARAAGSFPLGLVLYAQVRETVGRPDGRYAVLAPYQGPALLAARTEPGSAASNGAEGSAAPAWAYGDWLVVAGVAEPPVQVAGRDLVYLRLLGVVSGPFLGEAPPGPAGPPASGPPEPAPSGRTGRVPGFFGL